MANKKINLKRILAISGCGAALAGALFFGKFGKNKKDYSEPQVHTVQEWVALYKVKLVRDTIDVAFKQGTGRLEIRTGEYNPEQNVAKSFFFRDVTGTEYGKRAANNVNKNAIVTEYHEVRHAMNEQLLRCCGDDLFTPDVFVIDEISARVAEYLAFIGNMPALKTGDLSCCQSYVIEPHYTMNGIADAAIYSAVTNTSHANLSYVDVFMNNALTSKKTPLNAPLLSKNELINELMTFKINGKEENILASASPEMIDLLSTYIDNINREILNRLDNQR